jgi:two-component system response regulator AtoC
MGIDAEGYSIKTAVREVEKKQIQRALEKTGGNRTHAARLLEISHPSLLKKIKEYKIKL